MVDDVPKKIARKIVKAYSQGTVPREGLQFVAVGRKDEIKSILRDFEDTEDGDGTFRFIVGGYGSGKSFLTQLVRNQAVMSGFVVMDADFSMTRRLVGSKREGLNMYRELIKNMSIKSKPDGGAVETIIKRWVDGIRKDLAKERGRDVESVPDYAVIDRIRELTEDMASIRYYDDFIDMVTLYWKTYRNEERDNPALKWIKGEYEQKTLAKRELGIGTIIDDQNWYEFIKVWAKFSVAAGYKGLIVMLDEGINLYKLTSSKARENNYECILSMYNDITQGKSEYLSIYMCETPKSLEDRNRGLYSYDAIRTRIEPKRLNASNLIDQMGPIITLLPLTKNEMMALLFILRDIHARAYDYVTEVTDRDIQDYLGPIYASLGVQEMLTPRQVAGGFIEILNLKYQNPKTPFMDIVRGFDYKDDKNPDEIMYEGLDL